MQIFVENMAGSAELPARQDKRALSLYNNRLRICLLEKESVKLECDGHEECYWEPGDYTFPINWDRTNRCAVSVRTEEAFFKYHFQLENTALSSDENIMNLFRFVGQLEENFRMGQEYKVEELFRAIKEDKVPLIIEKAPYSGYDDRSLLREIAETVPMVMDICSHPKQSLRTEEAVLDVNLVKRINSRTMDHLASHSEHWKARTLNGLIPNRLRADIFEDEVNIYENLFFRMAVDDVLKYIHRQAVSIEKTIQQNDYAIDWNAYGEMLYDYKRMKIFRQLLPDYDVSQRQEENNALRALLSQWEKLERSFSTAEASQFYRSIDKKKHISRNIQPTNILKKDSRYNALYRLWCEIHRQIVKERQAFNGIEGVENISLSNCYSMYVAVLLLYAFRLLECETGEESVFRLHTDGAFEANAVFYSDAMDYMVETGNNAYGTLEIKITYIEKVRYDYVLPQEVMPYIKEIEKKVPEQAALDCQKGVMTFFAMPSAEEQRSLKNLFHINQAAQKGMKSSEREAKKQADKVWRPKLEELFASDKIQDARSETLLVMPQFAVVEDSEHGVDKFTQSVLDCADTATVFTFPIDLDEYRKNVKSEKLIHRLLNYGEKYSEEDARRWGNYRTGIIPVGQADINSAQRLMKLISIHSSRLQIKWHKQRRICPVCGSDDCIEGNGDNWKCKNPECGVLFGMTRHADVCKSSYEWTRPVVEIKKKDVEADSYMDFLLRKETIFDRLAITDFDFEEQIDGTVKYIPVCPKCGKRKRLLRE